ncbi:MAG: hypothetical protein ABIY90_14745, partial [Puia sp.]
ESNFEAGAIILLVQYFLTFSVLYGTTIYDLEKVFQGGLGYAEMNDKYITPNFPGRLRGDFVGENEKTGIPAGQWFSGSVILVTGCLLR